MNRFWKQAGLAQKIIILITLILIFPTAVLCAVYYGVYWNALLLEAEDGLTHSLNAMVNEMDDSLDSAEAVLDELDYSQELFYFLSSESTASAQKTGIFLIDLQQKWVNIRYAYPNQFHAFFLYSSHPETESLNSWKWYVRPFSESGTSLGADNAKFVYAPPQAKSPAVEDHDFTVIESHNLVLPVWLTVRDFRSEQAVGGVRLDIPLERLIEAQTLKNTWPDQTFLLMDHQNHIYYQSGALPQDSFLNDVRFPEDGTAKEIRLKNGIWLAAGSQCARTGLIRVSMIKKTAVTKSASSMAITVGAVAMAGVFLVMLLIGLTVHRMLNRLMELDSVMGRMGNGDLTASVPEDDEEDEVSRIRRSFNEMAARLRELIRRTVEQEEARKDAELKALRAQINPHFLFNTLESMRMQCEIDRYTKVENGLSSLGKLLRYTLRWESDEVAFLQEWNYLKSYLALMSLRWEQDLTCETDCSPAAESVTVPRMVLQPLVENSFQHGFKGVPPPWILKIDAALEGGCLRVTIRDNGSGIDPDRLERVRNSLAELRQPEAAEGASHSIGIVNVAQRIHHLCKPGSGIFIGNRTDGCGAEIALTIVL